MRILDLLSKGPLPYLEGDRIQRSVFAQVSTQEAPSTLIVAEFEPCYTAGKLTQAKDVIDSDLPIIKTDRGGSITWHGPGQLVIYPVVRLQAPIDRIKYIRTVETAVVQTIHELWQLPATTIADRAGVWLRNPDRKLCAIGLRVAKDTTMHGLALNINPDFTTAFQGIIPCGIDDAAVSSLAQEGINTTLQVAAAALTRSLRNHLVPLLADHAEACASGDPQTQNRDTHSPAQGTRPVTAPPFGKES